MCDIARQVNGESFVEKFAQAGDIKSVFRRSVRPAGFGLVRGAGDYERRDVPLGPPPLKLFSMAQYQVVNTLAEEHEKLFAPDFKCAQLPARPTCAPALIADGCVDRKRPQPICFF